jgi:dihydroflavonol-4-reductase
MKILITGGTGFIGSQLALRCLQSGHAVSILAQVNTAAEAANKDLVEAAGATVMLASIMDRKAIGSATRGVEVVYHLAAAQHEAGAPDQQYWDVNVSGTRSILEATAAGGLTRFVHASTIGVFGSPPTGPISECAPLRPDNIYGRTKLEAEQLALRFCDRLPVAVVRVSETYGPGDRRLLKLFRAIKRRRFVHIGAGTNLHHPIYVDDLTDGLLLAARSDAAVGRTPVLAGKDALTTSEMVAAIATELGVAPPRLRVPLAPVLLLARLTQLTLRPLGINPPLHPRRMDFFRKSFLFSTAEALSVLGFAPKYSFARGVRETAQWYTRMGYL